MPRSNHLSSFALLLAALGLCAAGCNSGVAAIVGASQSSSNNAAGIVSSFQVLDARDTPARLRFNAVDTEGDDVELQFVFRLPGGALAPMTGLVTHGNPATFAASAGGVVHEVLWDYAGETGIDPDGLNADVEVLARRPGTAPTLVEGGNGATADLGNDPPAVESIAVPGSTVAGIALIELLLRDSSSELVDVSIEYDVEGDVPDAGWRLARPAGATTTPTQSMTNVLASAAGTTAAFFWDTSVDLASSSASVRLRATPRDLTEVGATMTSDVLGINNNTAPFVVLDSIALLESTDRSQGYTLKYTALDEEGDRVEPVVQWRRAGEAYPALPSDPNALRAILDDPEERAAHQLAVERPRVLDVDVAAIDELRVRFPREAEVLARLGVDGPYGGELSLLRPGGTPRDVATSWPAGTVSRPTDLALADEPGFAWVLDEPAPFSWRLQRVELATGAATALAEGMGAPLAFETFHGDALVAATDASGWTLTTVDLGSGAVLASGSGLGAMRGLDAVHARMAVATVDDAVVRIGLPQHGVEVTPILTGLDEPWGLALDPYTSMRAWVCERGADRILELDLETHVFHKLPAASLDLGLALPGPRALELTADRTGLLVVCEDAAGAGTVRLRSLGRSRVGPTGAEGPFVDVLFEAAVDARLASGPSSFTGVAEPGAGTLRVAGGVEQVRRVDGRDPSSGAWSLDAPLSPVPTEPRQARLRRLDRGVVATPEGQVGHFAWDLDAAGVVGAVFLRSAGLDQAGRGLWTEPGFALELRGASPVRVVELPVLGAPVAFDLDGDGDLDLVGGEVGDTRVALQRRPGVYEVAPTSIDLAGPACSYEGILPFLSFQPQGALSIVPADLDRDGLVDLVAAGGPGSFQVAFQEPGGTFAPPVPFGGDLQSAGTLRVGVLDVEGDGQLEVLAFVSDTDLEVQLFTRTGPRQWSGVVAVAPDPLLFPFENAPAVDPYDVDGDGVLDLRLGGARLYRRTGPGEYLDVSDAFLSPSVAPLSDETPSSAPRFDIDEDGALDLAVQFGVLIDLFGPGSPQAAQAYLYERGPGRAFDWTGEQIDFGSQVAVQPMDDARAIDLDGDGRPEVVGISSDRTGTGTFTSAALVARRTAPGVPWSVDALPAPISNLGSHGLESEAIVDLDGDGHLELLERLEGGGAGALGFGVPGGALTGAAEPTDPSGMSGSLWAVEDVAAADIDGDGALDLILADTRALLVQSGGPSATSRGSFPIYLQVSPRRFERSSLQGLSQEFPLQVALADFDGDGATELVSLSFQQSPSSSASDSTEVKFREFEPGPVLPTFGQTLIFGFSGGPDAIDVADVDLDGLPDVVGVTQSAQEGVGLELLRGVEGMLPERTFVPGGLAETFPTANLSVADVDGDGLPDVVTSNLLEPPVSDPALGRPIAVWYQEAAGGFQPTIVPSLVGAPLANLTAADVDGDGRCDLVYSEVSGADALVVALQTAPGVFKAQRFEVGPVSTRPPLDGPVVEDVDGDGLRDVLATCHGEDLVVLRQYAPGRFEVRDRLLAPAANADQEAEGGLAVDLDGDGALDVVRLGRGFPTNAFTYPFAVHWGGE